MLKELKEIEARVSALIKQIESESPKISTTVGEIRRVAILDEIFRSNASVLPEDISQYATKYGKTPSSCAGYFSGKSPSLVASDDRKLRVLTDMGKKHVQDAREKWGTDWVDRIPADIMDIIKNSHTPASTEVSF